MSSAEIRELAVATDTELARIFGELGTAEARLHSLRHTLSRNGLIDYQRRDFTERAEELESHIADLNAASLPLSALYLEHGWTRAFLVNNSSGHVHRDMHCSTCFPTTSYMWLPAYSGSDEEQIIEAAGERACTICYPDAPVEVLSRPSRMKSDEDVSREEREAEKAARREEARSKALIDPDTDELVRDADNRELRTERAARNAASRYLQDLAIYNHFHPVAQDDLAMPPHPTTEDWRTAIFRIATSLAAKHDQDYDEVMFDLASRATRASDMRSLVKTYDTPLTVDIIYGLLG